MPKGKRKSIDEDEIEDAARRMQKHVEHLRAAGSSVAWVEFLENIGVNPDIMKSKTGGNFWENVRQVLKPIPKYVPARDKLGRFRKPDIPYQKQPKVRPPTYAPRELIDRGIKQEVIHRESTDKPITVFRDMDTGRFISGRKN